VRPDRPKPEAQRADSEGGLLEEGKLAPSPPARRYGGSAMSSTPGSGAEPQPLKGFVVFQRRQTASPVT